MKSRSKLHRFTESLLEMGDAGKTLAQIQQWLKERGVVIVVSGISRFMERRRQERAESQLLAQIIRGAQQVQEVEKGFSENPAPPFEMLIKLQRVLILQLSTRGTADPKSLKLANQLTQTAMKCLAAQNQAQLKEREIKLAEAAAAEAKKSKQQKALELCLEESKEFPEALESFKRSFALLKSAKARHVAQQLEPAT